MKGIEIFYQEAQKREFAIGETDTTPGETNGNFTISSPQGKTTTQNLKRISEVYGSLTFFHFTPEEAMKEIFEMIDMQMNQG